MKATIKYQVILKHSKKYSISKMCRFFEVSISGFYVYLKIKDRPEKDLPIAELIKNSKNKIIILMDIEECKYGLKEKEYIEIQKQFLE